MKKKVLLMAVMALSCATIFAQSTFDISGTVVEKANGEAVVAATIQLLALPDSSFVEGTTTGKTADSASRMSRRESTL